MYGIVNREIIETIKKQFKINPAVAPPHNRGTGQHLIKEEKCSGKEKLIMFDIG